MLNKFCHIAPTAHLSDFCANQTHHLLLAHLVESDDNYVKWYVENKRVNPDHTYILDNSAFEMYKQGREMYPSEKLVEMGHRVSADYVVLSDYPNEPGKKTIEAACKLAPIFKTNGFKTFFVPQSTIGDLQDYVDTFMWASDSYIIDYIGVSILGVPNAFGVEKNNKLQRFFSRWYVMEKLQERKILERASVNGKKIHFLGMVDGPNEIDLMKNFKIDSWDSSAAVWLGLNDRNFDHSPTGLIDGKFEDEVDFNFSTSDSGLILKASQNVDFINNKLVSFNE